MLFEKLEDLARYIRENVPQAKAITHLETKESMKAVTFKWNSTEFLVRNTLEVFQVKEEKIYITASSMLMESVLRSANRIDQVLGASVESIEQAMEFFKKSEPEKATRLLDPVKKAIRRLIPK